MHSNPTASELGIAMRQTLSCCSRSPSLDKCDDEQAQAARRRGCAQSRPVTHRASKCQFCQSPRPPLLVGTRLALKRVCAAPCAIHWGFHLF